MKNTLRISDTTRQAVKPDGTKIPVVDSKFSFLIQPNEEDIKNGIRGDHANCMYCLAMRRMYNSELVWVTRSVAYVELLTRGGKPKLHRFILRDPAKMNVKGFDANEDVSPEAVIFAAPSGRKTLDYKKVAEKKYRKSRHKSPKHKAYIKGVKHKIDPFFATLRDPASGRFQFKNSPV